MCDMKIAPAMYDQAIATVATRELQGSERTTTTTTTKTSRLNQAVGRYIVDEFSSISHTNHAITTTPQG